MLSIEFVSRKIKNILNAHFTLIKSSRKDEYGLVIVIYLLLVFYFLFIWIQNKSLLIKYSTLFDKNMMLIKLNFITTKTAVICYSNPPQLMLLRNYIN